MGLSIVLWHLMAHTYTRLSLHDLVNLNLSMFCEVFLKLRKFCQLYDNFGANQTITFGWYNFSVKSDNPGSQLFLLFFITWRPSRHCHSVTRSDYNYKMFFLWLDSPSGPRPPVVEVSWSHSVTHALGRTLLDEWSARRRALYLRTHNTHKKQTSMPPVGFEPAIAPSERPQTYAVDRAATGIGIRKCITFKRSTKVICLFHY